MIFSQDIYIPDRPGYTYNSHLIGLHQIDVELGFGYNYMNFGEKTNVFYNTTAIRYGAFKHLEFRYEIDFGSIYTPSFNQSGVKGVTVGFKTPIYTNDSIISVAIIGGCYLPNIGVPYFTIPDYSPSLTLALQKSIGKFVILGNTGVVWNGFGPDGIPVNYGQGYSSLAIYYFPSRFGCFVETYCMYSTKTNPMNCGDAGILYCITDDIIWDFSFGLNYVSGLNNSFVNSGISWRIPNKHK